PSKRNYKLPQEREQLEVKQETGDFWSTLTSEESEHMEPEIKNPESSKNGDSVSTTNPERRLQMSTSHLAESSKPFSCVTCKKDFRFSHALTAHMRTHTGERLHSCSTCGKTFRRRSNLKSHLQIHTGEKPFTCQICGKSIRLKGDYNIHMRTHSGENPYSCDTCGKGFFKRSDLNRHVRIHSGERPPHCCRICGRDFRSGRMLECHMITHTGETLHSCSTCGEGFSQTLDLIRHIFLLKLLTGIRLCLCFIITKMKLLC
uniref:C2H2-type domain-containing protein n=1 Tax=Labrus bergylta TaxID=56723 RepID=A0A3Q3FLT5_9LABR